MTVAEKICFYLGIGVALVLLWMILFSTKGVMDYRDLKDKEARIKAQAALEYRQNRKVEKEINSLKHDMEYIRHIAKHEHGMAAPDEVIFKDKSAKFKSDALKPKDPKK